jgi:hypothetical protein
VKVVNPTAEDLRQLRRDNLKYPDHLVEVPREQWPMVQGWTGSFVVQVFRSRRFTLFVWDQEGATRLSVQRTEWDDRKKRFRDDISWDDLQRLKSEAGFGAQCAVELFPPDGEVVNVANMRHLFIIPRPAFMWR